MAAKRAARIERPSVLRCWLWIRTSARRAASRIASTRMIASYGWATSASGGNHGSRGPLVAAIGLMKLDYSVPVIKLVAATVQAAPCQRDSEPSNTPANQLLSPALRGPSNPWSLGSIGAAGMVNPEGTGLPNSALHDVFRASATAREHHMPVVRSKSTHGIQAKAEGWGVTVTV